MSTYKYLKHEMKTTLDNGLQSVTQKDIENTRKNKG